jgi:hypothetical protein
MTNKRIAGISQCTLADHAKALAGRAAKNYVDLGVSDAGALPEVSHRCRPRFGRSLRNPGN